MTAPGDDGFKMAGAYVELTVKDDTQAGVDEAKATIEATDPAKLTVTADLDEKSVEDVGAKVKTDTTVIGDESPVKIKVGLDEKSVADAEARIAALAKESSAASDAAAGGGLGGALIPAAIGVGSGALAGGALALIPAAFAAIGIEAEKSAPEVKQALASMEESAKSTLTNGFEPFAPVLVDVIGQAKSTITSLGPDFAQAAQASAPMLETMSTGLLTAARDGVEGAAGEVQKLSPVANAIGDDFGKVEQGVGGFFKSLDTTTAAQGLSLLGTDIQDALPAVGQLLNTVAPLGNAFLSVLGPALKDTGNNLSVVRPLFQGVGEVVSFLGPEIGALAPPALAVMGVTKLLTGSWTDFSGAAAKLVSPLKDTQGTLNSLASTIGITTASQAAQNKADLDAVASKAAITAALDREAAAAALEAITTDTSTKAKVKATETAEVAAASEDALAEATAAAAAASESASFSFGPLGVVLGVVGGAMALMGVDAQKATPPTTDLTNDLVRLGQAAPDAVSGILSGNTALQGLIDEAPKAGVNVQGLLAAYAQGPQALKEFTDGVQKSNDALGNTRMEVQGDNETIKQYHDELASGKTSRDQFTADELKQIDAYSAGQDVLNQLNTSVGDLTKQQQANALATTASTNVLIDSTQQQNLAAAEAKALGVSVDSVTQSYNALAASGIVLSQSQQMWSSIGTVVQNTVSQFNQATSGIKSMTDATIAADGANTSAAANFAHLDQAVTSSGLAYQQSAHGIVTAEQGVRSAVQGVQSAQYGVQQAEQSYQTALQQVAVAQQAIANARKQALQDEINLQLQANDAAAGQLSAGVNLFDAQTSAAALGVTTANAHQVAGETVTATNEAQVKAAIALIEAQNQVADSTNSSAQAQDSLNTAQAQGVNGNAAVVAANQQLVSSAQQVASAQHGVETAQLAVQSASLALQNAQYAVTQAQQAARQAAEAHQQAVDADSRSTDYSTQAGNQNWQMLETLFEKNFAASGSIQDATDKTEAEGLKMGFTAGQIDGVIGAVTRIPLTTNFSIVGTPSLNLATLIQQAEAEGINVNALGLTSSQIGLANALTQPVRGGSYAEGGLFRGAGTPTSDSNVIAVSDQEYIVNAASTAKHLPLIEAINNDELPGYASGGPISAKQAMAMNYHLAGWDAMLQSASYILQGGLGVNSPNLPAGNGHVDFGTFGAPSGGAVPGVPSSRAANEAIVQSVFANQFGWTGPEWNATIQLLMQESGFNNTAQNPTSTAYGMFQFLNSTWGGYGIPKTSDPTQQAIAGGRYIKARYVDPIGAENHERAYHWFENGGYLPPGATMAANGTGVPEMVLPPGMSNTLEAINTSVQGGSGPGSSTTHNWYIAPKVKTDSPTELAVKVASQVQWNLMTTVGG